MNGILLFLLILHSVAASPVFLKDKDYTFQNPLQYQIVYASFSDQNTQNKQFFAANFKKGDEMFLEVYVPVATKDDIAVLQITSHQNEYPIQAQYIHNPVNVMALKKMYKIEQTAVVNTTIVIEIHGKIKGSHYAVAVGKKELFNFFEYTIFLPYTIQRTRIWTRTFYAPFIFLLLSILYMLLWPLSRNRTWELIPKISAIAYFSWMLDIFLQYFVTIQFSNAKSIWSFILHIVPNVVIIYMLIFSNVGASNKQKELFLGLSIGSLFLGGAGGYVGSSLLLISASKKYFQYMDTKKAKEKIMCKV